MTGMPDAEEGRRYANRHGARAAASTIVLEDERLSSEVGGRLVSAVRLDAITSVRLSIGMAGRDTQILCRVQGKSGAEIVLGSKRWTGPGQWREQAREFRLFLARLHAALEPRWDEIAFVEGPSPRLRGLMFGLGILLAVGGSMAAAMLLWRNNPWGLFAIAPSAAGAWLALIFRPARTKTYDPAAYARL
ncbi:hypothetical protein [Hyphobacterium marinum]|uniref:Uncharacterized protein n=1 Tax=Hyphobacterium marinum TaxID=3116574 RepID=A0ABU7LV53_9PROT|nr:hypothetical protein [Hyphobacterium sp. Y6023]MEE2565432.1 hypothetical protein [Hyphobacterium sp. Y6023]